MDMKYALIRDGIVVNSIVASPDFVAQITPEWDHIVQSDEASIGWLYVDGSLVAPEPSPVPTQTWRITKLAFKNRFPRSKWIAARQAAAVDLVLGDFFESFELASYIDLERQDTRDSVTAMSDPAIPESIRLTSEEVVAVIDVPAGPDEIPRGV